MTTLHTSSDESFKRLDFSYRDLAPDIHRQRMLIEGIPTRKITSDDIKDYLAGLSEAVNMTPLNTPVTHRSNKFGWAGWIHWEESGAHFYAWEQPSLFFSVDIYTCSHFNEKDALKYTGKFFNTTRIVGRSV